MGLLEPTRRPRTRCAHGAVPTRNYDPAHRRGRRLTHHRARSRDRCGRRARISWHERALHRCGLHPGVRGLIDRPVGHCHAVSITSSSARSPNAAAERSQSAAVSAVSAFASPPSIPTSNLTPLGERAVYTLAGRSPSHGLQYDLPMSTSKNTALTTAADGVGAVSAVLGGLLTIAPFTGGRWLGLTGTTVECRRALGTADLALGITIIAGRSSRWRWRAVAVRALLHLLFAREYMQNSRRGNAVAMCALFVIDAGIAFRLREESRSTANRYALRWRAPPTTPPGCSPIGSVKDGSPSTWAPPIGSRIRSPGR